MITRLWRKFYDCPGFPLNRIAMSSVEKLTFLSMTLKMKLNKSYTFKGVFIFHQMGSVQGFPRAWTKKCNGLKWETWSKAKVGHNNLYSFYYPNNWAVEPHLKQIHKIFLSKKVNEKSLNLPIMIFVSNLHHLIYFFRCAFNPMGPHYTVVLICRKESITICVGFL